MFVNVTVVDCLIRTGLGDGFRGCSRVPLAGNVAKGRITRGVLHSGNVCSIAIADASNVLASRCGPVGGAMGLDRKICNDTDITTTTMTTRRYKRTMRRTQKCTPLHVHSTLIPIMRFSSSVMS